tara:strand:+ start:423 stop:1049 length:627 start_codon:yes stop_codon:yes gene_type:complete
MSQLKLTADSGGGTVAIKGPASTTGNAALEMTVPSTASGTLDSLNRAGNILQVVEARKTDTFTHSSGAYTTITGLSLNITPSSSSNKVLIMTAVNISGDDSSAKAGGLLVSRTVSGSENENIFVGDANGSNSRGYAHMFFDGESRIGQIIYPTNFLDVPSTTSAITYAVKVRCVSSTPIGVNYAYDNNSTGSGPIRTASSIIAMEIAA